MIWVEKVKAAESRGPLHARKPGVTGLANDHLRYLGKYEALQLWFAGDEVAGRHNNVVVSLLDRSSLLADRLGESISKAYQNLVTSNYDMFPILYVMLFSSRLFAVP
jgi:hypothetical protein